MKYIYVFLSIFLVSCVSVKSVDDEIQTRPVKVDNISDIHTMTDIYSDFELLPLKTGDDGIFKDISKLVFHDGNYYLLDKVGRKQILVFGADGVYKHSIGNLGKGKGEYANIEDFTIDVKNNRVVVLAYPSTIFVYDMQGQFISSRKLETNTLLWNIISYDDGFICSTNHMTYTEGENAYLFYFFDNNFEFVDKCVPVLPRQMHIPLFVSCPFQNAGDGRFTYFDGYTSNVYVIDTNDGISMNRNVYELNNPMPIEMFADIPSFASNQMKYDYFMRAIYADNNMYAFFLCNGQIRGFVSDLTAEKVNAFNFSGWIPKLMYQKDGIIYSVVSVSDVVKNEDLFGSQAVEMAKSQSNDLILKFKCTQEKH